MASIYERKGSKFYWVKYRDPLGGKIRKNGTLDPIIRESTGFVRSADGRRKALLRAAELTRKELESPRARPSEMWKAWVPAFLEGKYKKPKTAIRVKQAWAALTEFFRVEKIAAPRHLDYATASKYFKWRAGKTGLRKAQHNTALLEFSYLRTIMKEAVKREYAPSNPCREVEESRVTPKQKLEITEEHHGLIALALCDSKTPQWMRDHWQVLMTQGCRCSEAFCPLSEIDAKRMTIRFRVKGGKYHTAPLHKDLLPLVHRAHEEGRELLVETPEGKQPAKVWWELFRKLELPYSLHCTRVTVITKLLRAGFTGAEVSAYIGHTEEVNIIYRRLNPADVSRLGSVLGVSSNPNAGRGPN